MNKLSKSFYNLKYSNLPNNLWKKDNLKITLFFHLLPSPQPPASQLLHKKWINIGPSALNSLAFVKNYDRKKGFFQRID